MGENDYLNLMCTILEDGEERIGRNGTTKSIFGGRLEFNLKDGFPALTTKRVFMRGVIEELLWFLRGSTDVKELQAKNVHIWDGNSTREFLDSVGLQDCPEHTIGKAYGWQWRNFGGTQPGDGFDQLEYLIKELKDNPTGRRAVLSAWNPKQMHEMALPPCHFAYTFYNGTNGLCCQMVMRSCDVGAGLPFNIASTALFTHILAHALHLDVDKIIIVTGDTHLYSQHYESARIQIARCPLSLPKLRITSEPPPKEASSSEVLRWIEALEATDFVLDDYKHHPPLTYEMVV